MKVVRELSRTGTFPTALEYGLNGCNSKGTRVPLSAFSFEIGIYERFLFTAEVVFCESALVSCCLVIAAFLRPDHCKCHMVLSMGLE